MSTKYNIFKPDDFSNIYKQCMKQGFMSRGSGDMWEPYYTTEDIAKEVNEIFNKIVESWIEVTGKFDYTTNKVQMGFSTTLYHEYDVDKARLAFIEPITKDHCKHEVAILSSNKGLNTSGTYRCKDCGIELVAKWEAK